VWYTVLASLEKAAFSLALLIVNSLIADSAALLPSILAPISESAKSSNLPISSSDIGSSGLNLNTSPVSGSIFE